MAGKSIVLRCFGLIRDEAIAATTIKPGEAVALDSNGKFTHASAGNINARQFAVEDDLQGNDIDDSYSSGDRTQANTFRSGDRLQAWLAAGENVSKGGLLKIGSSGQLAGGLVGNAVAVALEAKDLSASGASAALIEVQVL